MINAHFRRRLMTFLEDHDEDPCDDDCVVAEARAWFYQVQCLEPKDQEREILLMAMAYKVYSRLKQDADEEMEKYQAAIAAFISRNGGVLKLPLEEIEVLDGTVTTFIDSAAREITYRFIQQSGYRS